MRRRLVCIGLLSLAVSSRVVAQDSAEMWEPGQPDDYEAYFGERSSREAGPVSLEEARRQGRGYRIGESGRPVLRESAKSHQVVPGDTLWGICDRYFGDPWQWPRIWSYNPEITNPHWIYPDTLVRLTAPTGGMSDAVVDAQTPTDGTKSPNMDHVVIVPDEALTPGTVFLRDQGYLDDEALKSLGVINGAPEERMVLSVGNQAYVKFGDGASIKPGDELSVFRKLDDWERFATEQGELVKITGSVLVRSYDPQTHVARVDVIESLDVIERGSHVARVARRFDLVSPRENTTEVVAHIIASTRPRGLLSYGDVVFLDVGAGSGVVPGNRFFVTRQRDEFLEGIQGRESEVGALTTPPEYHPEEFPREIVAELRVIKVRKESTIAFVTRSDKDFTYGDTVEMHRGF